MATFVLVPGGWHGGWWFEPLARWLSIGRRSLRSLMMRVGLR